jgi:hypothetical protein
MQRIKHLILAGANPSTLGKKAHRLDCVHDPVSGSWYVGSPRWGWRSPTTPRELELVKQEQEQEAKAYWERLENEEYSYL